MKRDAERLEDIEIKAPCSADWEAMEGGAAKRHCEECDLHVHNLSAMTRAEGEALLAGRRAGERVCVRMEQNADGSCVTLDEPRGQKRPGKLTAAALAFGVGLSAACHTDEERGQDIKPQVEEQVQEVEAPPVEEADCESLQLLGSVLFVEDECSAGEAGEEVLQDEPEPQEQYETQVYGPQNSRVIMGSPGAPNHR